MKTKMFLSAAFASAMLLGATGISAYELTFAQCDAKRAAILAPAAKPAVPQTPEQKEYSKAVAQNCRALIKICSVPKNMRRRLPPTVPSLPIRRQNRSGSSTL